MQPSSRAQGLSAFRPLVAFVLATIALSTQAQINLNENGQQGLGKAWGYYIGQQLRLARVERAHPELSSATQGSRSSLNLAFPNFEANARRSFMARGSNDAQLDQFVGNLTERVLPLINKEPIDRAASEAFLSAVTERAKGNDIPEDVLQYLLATSFMDRPEREMLRGWRQRFSSAGHPKAKGVTVQLQLPRSFRHQEAERPNIVAKWTSEGGSGLEMMMLLVKNSAPSPFSRKEIEDDLRLGDASEIRRGLSEDGTVLSVKAFSQERTAGYIAEMQQEIDRAGFEVTMRSRMYMLLLPSKAVTFICTVGALREAADSLEAKMQRFSELCRLTANTLVLPQQYDN